MPTKREVLLVGIVLVVMLVLANLYTGRISEYRALLHDAKQEIAYLEDSMHQLIGAMNPLDFKVETWVATAYAPLDPRAVEGVCYSGDPNITASGREIRPGITVAAGPSIPFGTWLWIEGLGWRCVEDRGGNITDGRLDIAMISRDEAINFGRREVTVVIPIWR